MAGAQNQIAKIHTRSARKNRENLQHIEYEKNILDASSHAFTFTDNNKNYDLSYLRMAPRRKTIQLQSNRIHVVVLHQSLKNKENLSKFCFLLH